MSGEVSLLVQKRFLGREYNLQLILGTNQALTADDIFKWYIYDIF